MICFGIVLFIILTSSLDAYKPYKEKHLSGKYSNPDYLKDRDNDNIHRPALPPDYNNRFKQPWKPSYMDYCDLKHCNAYNKRICGGNPKLKKYRWFQSECHMQLSNECYKERGTIEFAKVSDSKCNLYMLTRSLRDGEKHQCPKTCGRKMEPVCAVSNLSGKTVIFENNCFLELTNCHPGKLPDEFEKISYNECIAFLTSNLLLDDRQLLAEPVYID